jgi:hypothetical protein
MRRKMTMAVVLVAIMVCGATLPAKEKAAGDREYLGRWDVTIAPAAQGNPRFCWLEVTREGGQLKGRFNQGGGAVFPLPLVTIENGELKFEHGVGRPQDNKKAVYRVHAKGGRLEGTATFGDAAALALTGIRGPKWPASPKAGKPGAPIELFNGKDLTGWLPQFASRPLGWVVNNGILVNEARANNIYTSQKFRDFKLHVEFNVDPKSNSGVYLRGRYEIQIADGGGNAPDVHSQGALYGFTVPPPNVEKPAGEWQTYDITIVANRLTVEMNGKRILENAEVPGITGGALDAAEGDPGPIMVQGDHGRVQFRKIVLTPLGK